MPVFRVMVNIFTGLARWVAINWAGLLGGLGLGSLVDSFTGSDASKTNEKERSGIIGGLAMALGVPFWFVALLIAGLFYYFFLYRSKSK